MAGNVCCDPAFVEEVEHIILLPPAVWRRSPIVVRIRQVLPANMAKNSHFSHIFWTI
jgi:hypothetical protein